jgi:hypothetical protein
MSADIPPLRQIPNLTMRDTGMEMGSMSGMSGMDHAAMDHGAMVHGGMNMRDPSLAPPNMAVGVGVQSISPMPENRLAERPLGL